MKTNLDPNEIQTHCDGCGKVFRECECTMELNIMEWMLQNITDNSFSSTHIYKGLKLSQFDREAQESMCRLYRRWRNLGMKPKYSYDLVLYGLEPEDVEPRMAESETR